MKSILFVDDEPRILAGFQRQFHAQRAEWTMRFANSGAEALTMLNQAPADVLVTDMMMPGMDGAQLLEQVVKLHPDTVRIVLSGHSSDKSVLRLVCPAHQYLAKPCEPDQLRNTITRALGLRELLGNAELKHLVAQIKTLPSLPVLYTEVMRELRSTDPSMDQIGKIIARDMAMSAKILQLVNSAFFGLGHHITHPSEAAMYLGVETMKSLVLSTQVFNQFNRSVANLPGFSIEALWQHCWNTSVFARRIAQDEGLSKEIVDQCFVSGLLHDVGKLILAADHSAAFTRALEIAHREKVSLWVAEKELFGSSHADIGAYLLGLWNFSHPIVEAVAYHHRTGDSVLDELGVAAIVHGANLLEHYPQPDDFRKLIVPSAPDNLHSGATAVRLEKWSRLCQDADLPET